MQATGSRNIRSGTRFNKFFPPSDGKTTTIKRNADLDDTMAFIPQFVCQTKLDTDKISQQLKADSLEETLSNIWHFVFLHIQYKIDKPGFEQIRRPARSWKDRRSGVDCDCFTVFIATMLVNLDIPHAFRITKHGQPHFQHIYVIVPKDGNLRQLKKRSDYFVLDCVVNRFDFEFPFTEKKDYIMDLQALSGLGQVPETEPEEAQFVEFEFEDETTSGFSGADAGFLLNGFGQIDPPQIVDVFDDPETGETTFVDSEGNEFIAVSEETIEGLDMNGLGLKLFGKKIKLISKKKRQKIGSGLKNIAGKVGGAIKKGATAVGKGVAKAAKGVAKGVKKGFQAIKKVVASPLRNGMLLAMKLNTFGLAKKMRIGFLPKSQAMKEFGLTSPEFDKIKQVQSKLLTGFRKAGGKEENLKKAILGGKGNKDGRITKDGKLATKTQKKKAKQAIKPKIQRTGKGRGRRNLKNPLAKNILAKRRGMRGFGQIADELTEEDLLLSEIAFEQEQENILDTPWEDLELEVMEAANGGLGEPITATAALAAASGILGALALLLKNIKPLTKAGTQEAPEVPTPTGDAILDQQQQSLFQEAVQEFNQVTGQDFSFGDFVEGGSAEQFVEEQEEEMDEPEEKKGIAKFLNFKEKPVKASANVLGVVALLALAGAAINQARKGNKKEQKQAA